MRKYLIAFIIGILLVPATFYLYVRSGHAPVATSASPLPFERLFAGLAMRATISHDLPKPEAAAPSETDLVGGARIYRQYCGNCHGLPNEPPSVISKGMYPRPPQFFHPAPVPAYDPSRPLLAASPKVYWKVKNGVRLTGMPGFQDSFTEQQIRQVSQFVSNARNLPPGAVTALEGKNAKAGQTESFSKSPPHVAGKRLDALSH